MREAGRSMHEIARAVGVPASTLYRWAAENDWRGVDIAEAAWREAERATGPGEAGPGEVGPGEVGPGGAGRAGPEGLRAGGLDRPGVFDRPGGAGWSAPRADPLAWEDAPLLDEAPVGGVAPLAGRRMGQVGSRLLLVCQDPVAHEFEAARERAEAARAAVDADPACPEARKALNAADAAQASAAIALIHAVALTQFAMRVEALERLWRERARMDDPDGLKAAAARAERAAMTLADAGRVREAEAALKLAERFTARAETLAEQERPVSEGERPPMTPEEWREAARREDELREELRRDLTLAMCILCDPRIDPLLEALDEIGEGFDAKAWEEGAYVARFGHIGAPFEPLSPDEADPFEAAERRAERARLKGLG